MSFKRTASAAALGFAALFSLTGCLNMDMAVTVNPDGETAQMSYSTGYNKEKITKMYGESGLTNDSDICGMIMESENAEVNGTFTETKTQCVITSKVITFNYDESGIKSSSEADEFSLKENVSITKNNESSTVEFDFKSLDNSDTSYMSGSSMTEMIDSFNIVVNFPGKVTQATYDGVISKDNHSVTWDLDNVLDSVEDGLVLSATGDLKEANIIPLFIGLGIAILISVTIVAAVDYRRKPKAKTTLSENDENE